MREGPSERRRAWDDGEEKREIRIANGVFRFWGIRALAETKWGG